MSALRHAHAVPLLVLLLLLLLFLFLFHPHFNDAIFNLPVTSNRTSNGRERNINAITFHVALPTEMSHRSGAASFAVHSLNIPLSSHQQQQQNQTQLLFNSSCFQRGVTLFLTYSCRSAHRICPHCLLLNQIKKKETLFYQSAARRGFHFFSSFSVSFFSVTKSQIVAVVIFFSRYLFCFDCC